MSRLAALVLMLLAVPPGARAEGDPLEMPRRVVAAPAPSGLRAGAVELGIGGSVVSEGTTSLDVATRLGTFLPVSARGLIGAEGSLGWARVADLDRLDALVTAAWLPVSEGPVLPGVFLTGGIRQEWVGSFSQGRTAFGGGTGLRFPTGRRVLFRLDYRFLRLFDEAVDRDEHVVSFGLSILFRNEPRLR